MLAALRLYGRLIAVQVRSQMQYRASFFLDAAASFMGNIIWFVTLALVMQRFDNIGGWTLGEVAFLYATVDVAFGIMDMLFSGFDPSHFSRYIARGGFDQFLLRPVNLTLQVLGSRFMLRRLSRILEGGIVLAVALSLAEVNWTAEKLLYYPLVVLSLVIFFGALFIVGATMSFWTVEAIEVINIFTYGGAEMMAYPMHIYPDWMRGFFTYIVPGIFFNYYPALYFLGKPDPFHLPGYAPFLAPLAAGAVLVAALLFWDYGIRHYQSTGT
ncbi:MAG: ABC-2 family transporter protein [Chloroflexi bacterium]|nr:ABC-2 family transporter protein [Chloroflexota bacterium]